MMFGNKKSNRLRFLAISGVAALCLSLTACVTAEFEGDSSTTGVSGTSTSDVRKLSVSGGGYGIRSIAWAEGGARGGLDKPCYMKVEFKSLSDSFETDGNDTVYKEINVCNSSSYNNGSMKTTRLAFQNLEMYLNEIRSCDSKRDANDRIKGITMWGAFVTGVEPDGSDYTCSTQTSGSHEYTFEGACSDAEVRSDTESRTNCGDWNGLRSCPSGMLASELWVHVSDDNEFVGLQLNCQEVDFDSE